MTGAKFDIEKFDGTGDLELWRIKMLALLIQHGCKVDLEVLPTDMEAEVKAELNKKAHSVVILCLGNKVLREVTGKTSVARVWSKLETLFMTKSLANKLYLKKKLYTLCMPAGRKIFEHIDEFKKIVLDLANIETGSFDFRGRDGYTKFKGNQKRSKAKGDDSEGLYVRGRTDRRDSRIQQQNGLVNETNVTLFVNRSLSSAIGFKKPIDMLGFLCWLISIKHGMLEPVKVKCIFLGYHKSIVGNKLWRFDDVTSKVALYMNMGFKKSGEYKKTFIGAGVGTGLMQVLHGFEFEVEPLGDHTFEVEPQENFDQGAGLQEVQTQDLMYHQLARDREQHLACELFGYREDINEAAFVVAAVEKIYAHESLTFNNTVAYEVISKWKAGLKDDVRSHVYVLSNGYRKRSDDSHGYYW
ncbi:hypothetical protein Tco_1139216 [Tanacetum coccineum]